MAGDEVTNGTLPAFPPGFAADSDRCGLTKREYIAAICLQGILANKSVGKLTLWSTTQSAVMYADQLLACLEQDAGETSDLAYDPRSATPLGAGVGESP